MTDSSTLAISSAAGFISELCDGTLTGSFSARLAPSSTNSSIARSTATVAPAITIWPGELKLTASTGFPVSAVALSHALITCSSNGPMIAAIAPSPCGTAFCISRPRSATSLIASWKSSTSAATRAAYSPRLCPASAYGLFIHISVMMRITATSAASMAGCVISVRLSFSSGPLDTMSHRS